MSFPWKDEHMEPFLEMYRDYDCLWNKNSDNYNNANVRENAYKAILSELNVSQLTIRDIRAKIKTIRTRYCSEVAKIRKSQKNGGDLYVPRLFWFRQADSFLRDVCKAKDTSANKQVKDLLKNHANCMSAEEMEELEENYQYIEVKNEGSEYTDNFTDENMALVEYEMPEETTIQFTTTNHARKRRSSNNVEAIHGVMQKLEKLSDDNQNQKPIHEFDAFCNSLAIQLKKMPLRQALICQEKLQAVMTQHRLSLL